MFDAWRKHNTIIGLDVIVVTEGLATGPPTGPGRAPTRLFDKPSPTNRVGSGLVCNAKPGQPGRAGFMTEPENPV